MKIPLPIDYKVTGVGPWLVVDAEIVDVAPHLANVATFAVHKYPEPWFAKWVVTNVETGLRVSKGNTKRAAVEAALERLRYKSIQLVVARLNKNAPKVPA